MFKCSACFTNIFIATLFKWLFLLVYCQNAINLFIIKLKMVVNWGGGTEIPDRILNELPKKISKKIIDGVELDESDRRVSRAYLDNTILHPENVASTEIEALSLFELYMHVGAKVSEHSKRYACRNIRSENLRKSLQNYDNISDELRITLKKSPITTTSFLSFCTMNADRGFKNWNFYAENFNKLIKTINRWVHSEGAHLKKSCGYTIYIEKDLIGYITKNKKFIPAPDEKVYNFIVDNFGAPSSLNIYFSLKNNRDIKLGFDCIIVEGVINDVNLDSRLMCALPEGNDLKVKILKEKIIDGSQDLIKQARFKESLSSDISANIYVGGLRVAYVELSTDEPIFVHDASKIIAEELGLEPEHKLSEKRGLLVSLIDKLWKG